MKIIEPKVEFYTERNPLKRIERIARVCWHTESRITETSAKDFCAGLLKMGHTSPFEHARIHVGNDLYDKLHGRFCTMHQKIANLGKVVPYGFSHREFFNYDGYDMNARDFIAFGGTLEELATLEIADDFTTVLFTVDIGISRELCRHRQMSFMEQSTRYVNMKDGIEFVRPLPFEWANEEWEDVSAGDAYNVTTKHLKWKWACAETERIYKEMIENGCTPQEARTVLPLSTSTRIYVTGTFRQWGDLLRLRLGKGAHPSMKYVMRLMLESPDCPRKLKEWEKAINE